MDYCFSCGKCGHKVSDFPNMSGQDKVSGQSQANSSSDASKKNHFYNLRSSGAQETSSDVVTCLLKEFSINGYSFLEPGSTLSFVTPLVDKKFEILHNILHEPFLVSTPVGE